jgi:hypothetical protein
MASFSKKNSLFASVFSTWPEEREGISALYVHYPEQRHEGQGRWSCWQVRTRGSPQGFAGLEHAIGAAGVLCGQGSGSPLADLQIQGNTGYQDFGGIK